MVDKAKFLFKTPVYPDLKLFKNNDILEEKNVDYIWTRNSALLRQYSKIIDENYDSELNLKDVYKQINYKDLRSHFRLGVVNGEVIAGVRLTVNDPYTEASLPSEKEYFKFKDLFPDIDLENNKYCEITRYTVKQEYRDNIQHYIDAFRAFRDLQTELGVKYMMMWSSRGRQRIYKRFAESSFKLVRMDKIDLNTWPEYKHINYKQNDVWVALYENEHVR